MTQNTKTYSAIDLLDKILEFTSLTPDPNQWNFEDLESNPPRHIRLKQIDSLIRALFGNDKKHNLPETLQLLIPSILSGDIIKTRSLKDYETVIRFIWEYVENYYGSAHKNKNVRLDELVFVFGDLLEFKRLLRKMMTFHSNWIEASTIPLRFSIYLTKSISENLAGKYDDLDKILGLLIDPNGLSFTEEELIADFNYPKEDLLDVDIDFM
jgi:hypothetical protein